MRSLIFWLKVIERILGARNTTEVIQREFLHMKVI